MWDICKPLIDIARENKVAIHASTSDQRTYETAHLIRLNTFAREVPVFFKTDEPGQFRTDMNKQLAAYERDVNRRMVASISPLVEVAALAENPLEKPEPFSLLWIKNALIGRFKNLNQMIRESGYFSSGQETRGALIPVQAETVSAPPSEALNGAPLSATSDMTHRSEWEAAEVSRKTRVKTKRRGTGNNPVTGRQTCDLTLFMNTQTPPVIVLVETQMPENIGAAARAMMNFGMQELRLVAPREAWPNKRAYDLAAHAGAILDRAMVYPTTRDAVADRTRIYAATARPREMVKPVFSPLEAAEHFRRAPEASAILFGPERTGLTNDDIALSDAIVTIPTAGENASINVAQSVVILAYQWLALGGQGAQASSTGPGASVIGSKSPRATSAEIQGFFDHLERELDAVDFWKVEEKKTKMWLNLRGIFARAQLTEQEVRSLHGVVACLKEGSLKRPV